MGCGTSRPKDVQEPLLDKENGEIKTIQDIKISNLTFFDESQKKITDLYDTGETLYFSKFGFVKKITKKDTREQRVAKIVNKKFIDNDRSQYLIANEIITLSKLNHPSIIQVFEYFKDDINYYFVYEFIDSGTLIDQLIESNNFSEKAQVLECLAYIHSNKIAHRDLSLKNVLIGAIKDSKKDIQVKIIDWNHAAKLTPQTPKFKTPVGDIVYQAPEVHSQLYDLQCDIWSLGVILFTLIEGEMPFYAKKEEDLINAIQQNTPSFDSSNWIDISSECKAITEQMLQKDPRRRPTAAELLNNSWFQEKEPIDNMISKSKHIENMLKFQAFNILQKAALTYIATQEISKYEKEQISQTFQKLDTENNGTLSREEINKVCKIKFGTVQSEQKLNEIFDNLDSNKNGKIDYNEFITCVQEQKQLQCEENIKKAFQFFDKDQNGQITLSELKLSLGYSLKQKNEKTWSDLMSKYDMDGDNSISYQEFKVIVSSFSQ